MDHSHDYNKPYTPEEYSGLKVFFETRPLPMEFRTADGFGTSNLPKVVREYLGLAEKGLENSWMRICYWFLVEIRDAMTGQGY